MSVGRGFVILFIVFGLRLGAHEVRPAYLELREVAPDTFDVLWKVPGSGENLRLGLYVELPRGCVQLTPPHASMINNAFTERWKVRCTGGLSGGTVRIAGLSSTQTDVLVRLQFRGGMVQVKRLMPSDPSFEVEASPRPSRIAVTYLRLGIEHILGGVDHLLFVLALVILVKGTRRLVTTITAFTLAHSLTLAGATLGILQIPGPPVEATIALSIVFVAAEIVHGRQGRPGMTARFPWVVAFTFGLLHGFGFAGALSQVGLPGAAIPVALLFFNLGVEVGQLLFIGAVTGLSKAARRVGQRFRLNPPAWTWGIPPYAIGGLAMFWVIQRLSVF